MGIQLLNLLEPVSEVVGKVVDHFLPPSMSEAEKEGARQQAVAMAQKQLLAEKAGFRRFMLDYEGRAEDLPPAVQVLRASVRPLLTYLLVGTTAWLVWNAREIPTKLYQLDMLCAIFWFGERAVKNVLKAKQS